MSNVLNLLLVAIKDNKSFFYKEYFPLDLFKIIYNDILIFEKQLKVVKQNAFAIEFINNPSEQIQLEAVKQYGWAIHCIKNPSEQVKLEAVKQNGLAIQFIKNPSEQVKLEAVRQNGYAIRYLSSIDPLLLRRY